MSEQPGWSAYRPDTLPPLSATSAGRGRLVVLAATDRGRDEGWAQEITLGLARSWAGVGADVLLIDCDLMTPGLHRLLHTDNGTGISDALLFGSSIGSMTVEVEDGRFAFVPAGSPLADPVAAFERSRWHDLANELVEGGTTVVVFAGAEAEWIDPLLEEASDLVVLAAARDSATAALAGHPLLRAAYGMGAAEAELDDDADWLDPLDLDPLDGPGEDEWVDPIDAVGAADTGTSTAADPVAAFDPPPVPDPITANEFATPADPVPSADPVAPDDPLDTVDPGRSHDSAAEMDPLSSPEGFAAPGEGPVDQDWEAIDAHLRETPPDVPIKAAAPHLAGNVGPESVRTAGRRRKRSRGSRRTALIALFVIAAGVAAWQFWPGGTAVPADASEVSAAPSTSQSQPAPQGPPSGETAASQPSIPPTQTPTASTPAPATAAATPVAATAQPNPTVPTASDVPRFTVAFGAFGSATRAATLRDGLRQAVPSELFFVAPVEVGGRIFHRVLGGGAASARDANQALTLLARASGRDASTLVVRETPLGFLMARAGDLDAASTTAASLSREGLPAYVLMGPDGEGPVGFRVYVGAFLDEGEAAHMAGLLQAAGHDAALAERRGVPVG